MIHRYLPYTITLRAPALLASFGDDPSSTRSLSFVPGSAIRGQVAQAIGDPSGQPDRQELFTHLILDGSVCCLNAYPRAGGHRTLPMPVSFQVEKNAAQSSDGTISVCDLAAFTGEIDDGGDIEWPEMALSPISERFVSLGAAQPLRLGPRRASRVHQQRDRSRGRAWKEQVPGQEISHGTIFTYEYLEPHQEFDGLVAVHAATDEECSALADHVKKYLRPPVLLGRSRRSGYGGDAEIQWHSPRDREVEGQGVVGSDLAAGTLFRLLTTSSYLGRNQETGQLEPSYLSQETEAAFSGRVRVRYSRWAFEPVGGFNRKWRLEVPQALACTAGSVLVLEAKERIPLADLLTIEHAGFGERKAEGFGRIVFLTKPTETPVLRKESRIEENISLSGPVPDLVCFVQSRILREELSGAIASEGARLARNAKSLPYPSLLGRLRTALRGAPEAALQTLQTWLNENSQNSLRRPALDQLERCRIDAGKSLAAWIREIAQVSNDLALGRLLQLDSVAQRFQVISEGAAHQNFAELGPWIRARLIDELLEALSRRLRSKERVSPP